VEHHDRLVAVAGVVVVQPQFASAFADAPNLLVAVSL
jgi:hypothetical protein